MTMQSGQLSAFYYRAGNIANKAINGLSGTLVNDGLWHHGTLVVDTNGGRLFLDGRLVVSNAWTGTMGAIGSTTPLTFGNLSNPLYPFIGDLDEVAVWNRALTVNEINYLKHRRMGGSEADLLAYWHLDEAVNSTVMDATVHTNNGTFVNSPVWVPSGAPMPLNVVSTNCLRFAGTGDYVSMPHTNDLNAF